MSDEKTNVLGVDGTFRMRMDILGLMLKGASYAALFVLAIWAFVYVFVIIGWFLPPESKEAVDPTPLSFWLEALQGLPFA